MKVTIIGSNQHAADFITDCEIVNDYTKADVIVCAGNINWRSIYQKFNKFTSKQIILALDDNGNLFKSKYGYGSLSLRPKFLNETIDIIHNESNLIYQGLFKGSKAFIPYKSNYKIYCTTEPMFYKAFGNYDSDKVYDYVRSNHIPVVLEFFSNTLPNLIISQLEINKFSNNEISKIINYRLCEYVLSH
jgi:hypothetical protein